MFCFDYINTRNDVRTGNFVDSVVRVLRFRYIERQQYESTAVESFPSFSIHVQYGGKEMATNCMLKEAIFN